ncbi:MAG TPA: hypothetical protein VMH61_08955 [Candidatus Acidoferrales bacterium]|nr:hypothetical protein [Candidatus Acidoferrales bacterium]
MSRPLVVVLALLVLAPPLARAETVDGILARHYRASGGLERMKAVHSMRLTGTVSQGPGTEMSFVMEKKRPALWRAEFGRDSLRTVQGYDGRHGWQSDHSTGRDSAHAVTPDDEHEMAEQADFDGPLVDWKAKGETIEYLGRDSTGGVDTWKLKVTDAAGLDEAYFIDTRTGLLDRIESWHTRRTGESDDETSLSDYRDVGGVLLPFRVTGGEHGSTRRQVMIVSRIELDVPLADARFQRPVAPAPTHRPSDTRR